MGMAVCSVCGRLSASGGDHLDCGEMRRAVLEDEGAAAASRRQAFGGAAAGSGGAAGGGGGCDLAVELRALLDHIGLEKGEPKDRRMP